MTEKRTEPAQDVIAGRKRRKGGAPLRQAHRKYFGGERREKRQPGRHCFQGEGPRSGREGSRPEKA